MNDFKDLRKAAFAVGLGFTTGKFAGEVIKVTISSIVLGVAKTEAKNGNKFAADACKKCNIDFDSEVKETDFEEKTVKMGFQCE